MKPALSVVIPCYNEEKSIPELLERLQKVFTRMSISCEAVCVNDGSRDRTWEVLQKARTQYPFLNAVNHPKNRGMEQGWKTGVENSSGEYICLIDADLQNLPEDIPRLFHELQSSNADIVQGFRSTIGRSKDNRYVLSKTLNAILNSLFGMSAKDNKSGFIICRKEVLEDILTHRFKYKYFQTFITVAAHAKGCRIREVETIFESRLVGKSFIKGIPVKLIYNVAVDLIKGLIEYRFSANKRIFIEDFLKQKKISTTHYQEKKGWRKLWFKLFMASMPVHHWLIRRESGYYYQLLNKSQWLRSSDIEELQLKSLKKLIHHAYYHVSYYRQLFDQHKIKLADIQSLADLQKIPFLTKADIKENLYFSMLSDNHDKRKLLKATTSGSTGEPFMFYLDKHQLEMRWAATLRSMEWTGYRFGDRQVRLWHQTLGMSKIQVFKEYFDAWFNRRIFFPVYELTEKNIKKCLDKIYNYNPVFIDGYAEAFNLIAKYIKDKGYNKPFKNLKAMMSSAQTLPDDVKKTIESAFNCKVYDKYGAREFSGIAYKCHCDDGYHIIGENYIVEILKDGKPAQPGETGEVIITDLNNYCMPFIRYRIGDLAVAADPGKPCACGRGLPKIQSVSGRIQAIIIGANGRYLPGTFFAHFFKDYSHLVKQYQVFQEIPGAIELRIIKGLRFDDIQFDALIEHLKTFVGEESKIDIQFVDHIQMVRTGKLQGSISKVPIDFQKINHDDLLTKNKVSV